MWNGKSYWRGHMSEHDNKRFLGRLKDRSRQKDHFHPCSVPDCPVRIRPDQVACAAHRTPTP